MPKSRPFVRRAVRKVARTAASFRPMRSLGGDHFISSAIRPIPRIIHKYRFVNGSVSAGVSSPITVQNLLMAAGSMAATTTTAYTLFSAVRVISVELQGTITNFGTIALQWISGNASAPMKHAAFTPSSAFPARLKESPPENSLASFWQNANAPSAVLFEIENGSATSSASILADITVELLMHDNSVGSTSYTSSALVVGELYYWPVDGVTGTYLPVGLPY